MHPSAKAAIQKLSKLYNDGHDPSTDTCKRLRERIKLLGEVAPSAPIPKKVNKPKLAVAKPTKSSDSSSKKLPARVKNDSTEQSTD